jgi:mono/diheme cytochrome c family protein
MSRQNKVTAQSHSTYYIDEFGMRAPIVGTVSRGHLPYIYKDSLAQPKQPLANPLLPNVNNLALGQKMFLTYCSPCHGNLADGDSRLRGQFPTPPTLHSQKVRDWQDGNIYHVIMSGQNNIMPSYSAQLNNEEAWSVVLYVRALQKAKNASAEDINEYKKESLNNGTK